MFTRGSDQIFIRQVLSSAPTPPVSARELDIWLLDEIRKYLLKRVASESRHKLALSMLNLALADCSSETAYAAAYFQDVAAEAEFQCFVDDTTSNLVETVTLAGSIVVIDVPPSVDYVGWIDAVCTIDLNVTSKRVERCAVAYANQNGKDALTSETLHMNLLNGNKAAFQVNIMYLAQLDKLSSEKGFDAFRALNSVRNSASQLCRAGEEDDWHEQLLSRHGILNDNLLQTRISVWAPAKQLVECENADDCLRRIPSPYQISVFLEPAEVSSGQNVPPPEITSSDADVIVSLRDASMRFVLELATPIICTYETLDTLSRLIGMECAPISSKVLLEERLLMLVSDQDYATTKRTLQMNRGWIKDVFGTSMALRLEGKPHEAVSVFRVPISYPEQIWEVIKILRRQLVYNKLVTSVFDGDFVRSSVEHGATQVIVEMGGSAFDLKLKLQTSDLNTEMHIAVTENGIINITSSASSIPQDQLARVLSLCQSIPMTMSWMINRLRT